MKIVPCVVIPVFNHGVAVGRTCERLVGHGMPIYLVDDGSDAATRERLTTLAAQHALIRILRLPQNRGKGAAVMLGLRQALQDGCTHALQIDADGQHDISDVARFLEAAQADSEAVICGQAVYDESVPKARLYGRYITHLWVWLETLSFAIKDSMCGYRMYPLAATCRVIEASRIPTRMDFDPAVVVRLAWAGLKIHNLPTQVVYPRDGISHFDMWRDNVRISRTHALLVLGMLWRLPILLWRKVVASPRADAPVAHWARLAERGSYLGMLTVFFFYRVFGRSVARALLYPIAAYFFITHRRARAASLDYLRRLYEYAGPTLALPHPPTWRDSWHHVYAFAESSLDKVAAWLGDMSHAHVEFPNRPELDALVVSRRGAVLIGAHLGNWEMSRALAHFGGYKSINAVVYAEHARRFTRLLERANAQFSVNLIPVSNIGPDTAVLLQEKIDRGELLVIVGDRTPPDENGRVTRVPFLGSEAPFAVGPVVLAALLGCPVYLFFCLREGNSYRVHLERFADRLALPRHAREEVLRSYVQRYASRLESYCIRAPYQWFNFYDFWSDTSAVTTNPRAKTRRHEFNETKPRRA